MSKLAALLNDRFQKKEKPKMAALAEQSSTGQLTSFAGIFGFGKLDEKEKEELSFLLKKYSLNEGEDTTSDYQILLAITSEVKAIHNQAAILHGERIKKAQQILKNYKEGAFTAWLMAAYGNRQTPYNFLQYFEFYSQMPKTLHSQIESMPRQAVYTLASRQGALEKKEEVVRNYKGETKQELLSKIRSLFPLAEHDRRREKTGENALLLIQRLTLLFESEGARITGAQKKNLLQSLSRLSSLIEKTSTDS